MRQTAASKIVPGWTVVAAKEWKPKIECPMLADLRAEAAHRDPKKSVANWNWEKCIEFLTTFPRPPGVTGFPPLPPLPQQTSQSDEAGEGTRAQLLAERPRRPSENTALAGAFASPTTQQPLRRSSTSSSDPGESSTQKTRWTAKCFLRLLNAILQNKFDFIDWFGKCPRDALDAKDKDGVWEKICLFFNDDDRVNLEGMNVNLLQGDIHVDLPITDFEPRHKSTPSELKDKYTTMKRTLAPLKTNRNSSGNGVRDLDSVAGLVQRMAAEKEIDLDSCDAEVADELENDAKRQVYATGSDIWPFCKGQVEVYYWWVLLEQHNLYKFVDMEVSRDERVSSDAPTPSASSVTGGRAKPQKGHMQKQVAEAQVDAAKALGDALKTLEEPKDSPDSKRHKKAALAHQAVLLSYQAAAERNKLYTDLETKYAEAMQWLEANAATVAPAVVEMRRKYASKLEAQLTMLLEQMN